VIRSGAAVAHATHANAPTKEQRDNERQMERVPAKGWRSEAEHRTASQQPGSNRGSSKLGTAEIRPWTMKARGYRPSLRERRGNGVTVVHARTSIA